MGEQTEYSLGELAARLDGTVVGDSEKRIRGVRGIERAAADELTFVSNPRYSSHARSTNAGAVLVAHNFPEISTATVRVADPYLALAAVIALFHRPPAYLAGIHPTASIGNGVELGKNVHIGAYVVVMDKVEIGDDSVLLPHSVLYGGVRAGCRLFVHAHAVVREGCVLGDDVVLQPGVVVGGDGFGFARRADGSWQKIPQAGRVVIESGVEVQANSCIDRGALGDTTIQVGAKIDNLVQVGHGSSVGRNTLLCAQVGLAGSTTVGERVILAGQVGVAGHCKIGDGVVATAQSGIPGDVEAGLTVSGYPAVENRQWLKSVAALNRLPSQLRNLYKKPK